MWVISKLSLQFHWLCLLLSQYHTSFSLLAVAGTSSTMLNKSGESGPPCVVPDLRGNTFKFSPLRMMGALLYSGMFSLYSLWSFYHKGCWIQSKSFLAKLKKSYDLFFIFNVMYHIGWLADTELLGANTGDPTHDKVMWKRPDGQGRSGLEGPPGPAQHLPPKPESVCLTILCLSPTPLTLMGGYPRPPLSKGNQLRALVNKSSGHNWSVSIQTPLMVF